MQDSVRHVVLDANVLSVFLHPGSTHNEHVRERSRLLLQAGLNACWPGIRLYTPAICIAEAMGVLDKYRFCTWFNPVRADPSRRLSATDHEYARTYLAEAVRNHRIEQLDQEPNHVLLAGLVSPVNARYQIRRKVKGRQSKVKPPMSAADCLIAGLAIHLVSRIGRDSVILVTADQRLADVLTKARGLKPPKANVLGLTTVAEQAGLEWSPGLYPNCINIQRATDADMKKALGSWPLPTQPLVKKPRTALTEDERKLLTAAWSATAADYGLTNPDGTAYGPALEDIKARFAVSSSVLLENRELFLFLIGERKAKRLPRPRTMAVQKRGQPRQMDLFGSGTS